jgi:hypothetical protein
VKLEHTNGEGGDNKATGRANGRRGSRSQQKGVREVWYRRTTVVTVMMLGSGRAKRDGPNRGQSTPTRLQSTISQKRNTTQQGG